MEYKDKLRRNLRIYYIVSFLTALLFNIPIWVAFERRYLTFSQMALFSVFGYAVTIILELPTGALADLLGRKKIILCGWIISAMGFIYLAFAHNASMFFISYLISSIGTAFVSGSDTAILYDSFKALGEEEKFSAYIARSGLFYRFALATGTFLGGVLYSIFPGLPYLAMAGTNLIAVAFLFFLTEPKIDTVKFSFSAYMQQTKDGFKEIMKTEYIKRFAFFYMLVGGITWSCLNYLNQPFAKNVGYNEKEMSILFGTFYIISSLAVYFLSKSKHILTRERVYLAFPILMAISLLPGIITTKTIAPFLILIVLFTGSSRFAFLDRYANQEFLSKYRATALSALNMLVSIFYIFIITISGSIQDVYGTRIIYTFLGILAVLFVLPTALRLMREHKRMTLEPIENIKTIIEEEKQREKRV